MIDGDNCDWKLTATGVRVTACFIIIIIIIIIIKQKNNYETAIAVPRALYKVKLKTRMLIVQ